MMHLVSGHSRQMRSHALLISKRPVGPRFLSNTYRMFSFDEVDVFYYQPHEGDPILYH